MQNQGKKDHPRPPIVTLMGHIDHGKTTLLDAIRKTNVTASEHGGITQHIGAYQITFQDKPITFIDTPGHAAFEKMRSRGVEAADIVILVVAVSDGVKPQTIEAIAHIKRAQKPTIVALTKTDVADINIEKVKKELQKEGIVADSFGGETPFVEVVAPKGKGLTELLEVIQLVWQMAPQPPLPDDPLEAVVVESSLDKKRGPVVTVIVLKGTLKASQKIQVDDEKITVRALIDDTGRNIKVAQPGRPVEILGFKHVLEVGSIVREIITIKSWEKSRTASFAEIIAKSEQARDKFKVVIKADVAGSLEAILAGLPEKIMVISSGLGEITQTDVAFAKAAHAPIFAFNIKTPAAVGVLAQQEGVIIKSYNVIYELFDDARQISEQFTQAKQELKIAGRAKIIATFNIEGQKIAGAKVTHGRIKLGDQIILKRSDGSSTEAKIVSLKKFKKDVDTVLSGQDCGIIFSPTLDFKEDDVIESLG